MNRITPFVKVIILVALLVTACTQNAIEENQVYVVSEDQPFPEDAELLNVEGGIPFQKYKGEDLAGYCEPGQVLLSIAPGGEEVFLMEKSPVPFPEVILGDPTDPVRVLRKNIKTGEQKTIVDGIPFVSKVAWNPEGNLVAFGGGERLTIYDLAKDRLVMENILAQETISNFFWSPDSKDKLYTEQPNLANASIYYVSSQRKVEAYETREETYYKGRLDNDYYYGTKWDFTTGEIQTVILDKHRKVIKTIGPGIFRDAYQKSLLLAGDHGFGLYYIKDINRPEEVIFLTKDYVYDAKFVVDGKIAFTTKTSEAEDNTFYLHIISPEGHRVARLKVYGGRIALSPDGAAGYVNGPVWQKVNFREPALEEENPAGIGTDPALAEIFRTIRGGMTIYYDYRLRSKRNWMNLEKYFTNTEDPSQWALFDLENLFYRENGKPAASSYALNIKVQDYQLNPGGTRASFRIRVSTRSTQGTGRVIDYALELVKHNENWYITGFSTFPESEERRIVEETVREILAGIHLRNPLYEELRRQPMKIGQVQFWNKGMNYFAPLVDNADAVKVYLYTGEPGTGKIYKLVLERTEQKDWELVKIEEEDLSGL